MRVTYKGKCNRIFFENLLKIQPSETSRNMWKVAKIWTVGKQAVRMEVWATWTLLRLVSNGRLQYQHR